jgi:hypothetical protein
MSQDSAHDVPSALIIVLDLNQRLWTERANSGWPSIQEVLENILTFLRAFFLRTFPSARWIIWFGSFCECRKQFFFFIVNALSFSPRRRSTVLTVCAFAVLGSACWKQCCGVGCPWQWCRAPVSFAFPPPGLK